VESVTLPPREQTIAPGVTQRYANRVFDNVSGDAVQYRPTRVSWRRTPTGDIRTIEKVSYHDSGCSLSISDEMRIWGRRKQLGFNTLILTF
jgi:hypothetical protein